VSQKKDLPRDLKGGNGIQRMLLERRLEMSDGELCRLAGVDLRRFAQRVQGRADCALRPLKSLSDAVGCGIAESALKALESLAYIAAERGLAEKLPQAVGIQQQTFDFVGGPNTEGTSAAGGAVPIAAEDAPGADRFPAQMHRVIASQKAVSDQEPNLFAMGTRGSFQLVENRLDILLGTTNPLTHDWSPSRAARPQAIHETGPPCGPVSHIAVSHKRRGMMSITREAGCKARAAGGGLRKRAAGCWNCQIKGATKRSNYDDNPVRKHPKVRSECDT